jgi:hypothetical protein
MAPEHEAEVEAKTMTQEQDTALSAATEEVEEGGEAE